MEKNEIKQIIVDELKRVEIIGENDVIKYDSLIIDNYQLNSIKLLELITAIEKRFDFMFADDELELKSCESVNAIAEIVAKHQA